MRVYECAYKTITAYTLLNSVLYTVCCAEQYLHNRIAAINVRINFIWFFCSFLSISRCSIAYLMAWCMAHLGMHACVWHYGFAWPLHMRKWTFALSDRFCRIQINCSLAVFFSFISNNQKILIHRLHDMLLLRVYFGGHTKKYLCRSANKSKVKWKRKINTRAKISRRACTVRRQVKQTEWILRSKSPQSAIESTEDRIKYACNNKRTCGNYVISKLIIRNWTRCVLSALTSTSTKRQSERSRRRGREAKLRLQLGLHSIRIELEKS